MSADDDSTTLEEVMGAVSGIPKEAREFVKKICGPAGDKTGQLIADKIRVRRFRNRLRVFQEANWMLRENNIDPQSIDLKSLVPILEGAALEEDDTLRAKWAGLLASAAVEGRVHASYPTTLAQLNPEEARVLELLFEIESRELVHRKATEECSIGSLTRHAGVTSEAFYVGVENLYRLRLCEGDLFTTSRVEGHVNYTEDSRLYLTPLGHDFVKCCRGPRTQEIGKPQHDS